MFEDEILVFLKEKKKLISQHFKSTIILLINNFKFKFKFKQDRGPIK
jgi:hypothetical protein